MQIKRFFCAFFLALILSHTAEAVTSGVTVHYPPDNMIMEFGLLGISMGVPDGSADVITATVNEKEVLRIVPDLRYECFSVPLGIGVNHIVITAAKKGETVFTAMLQAFRRSELDRGYNIAPTGFSRDFFHMKRNDDCAECHVLVPKETDRVPVSPTSFIAEAFNSNTVAAATSTCYSCHKRLADSAYVHGPVAVWSCLSCHDRDAEPVYSVKKPDTDVCFNCHTEQKIDWAAKKYSHGPVTIGKCAICHSPHGSENEFNLHKPTWEMCVNCHAEKGTGQHVLGSAYSAEGHPTRNRPDPVRIGKELSCASCHNPHASNILHLWSFDVPDMFALCKKCHFDK